MLEGGLTRQIEGHAEGLRRLGQGSAPSGGEWRRRMISPGGNRRTGGDAVGVRVDTIRMNASDRSAGRKTRRYRITVRGEVTQPFVEPLGQIFVESMDGESTLDCEDVDQAKLQAVLGWLYVRNIEIVSVVPDGGGAESVDRVMQ